MPPGVLIAYTDDGGDDESRLGAERVMFLKLDKKQLDRLADLPDDQLWRTLKMLAPHAGLELSEKARQPDKLARLRAAMRSMTEHDVDRLSELVAVYRRGGKV